MDHCNEYQPQYQTTEMSCYSSDDDSVSAVPDESARRVRFAGRRRLLESVRVIPSRTEQERKACFYTLEEKNKMKGKHSKTVQRLESGKAPKKGHTYRGLEASSLVGNRQQKAMIAKCVDAVMDEQCRQWKVYQDDYDKLAQISLEMSSECKQLALELAQFDALEVLVDQVTAKEDDDTASHTECSVSVDNGKRTPKKKAPASPTKSSKTSASYSNRGVTTPTRISTWRNSAHRKL